MDFTRRKLISKVCELKNIHTTETIQLLSNIIINFSNKLNNFIYDYKNIVNISVKTILINYQEKLSRLFLLIKDDSTNIELLHFKEILNELQNLSIFLKQNKLDYKEKVSTIKKDIDILIEKLKTHKLNYITEKNNLDIKLQTEININHKELDRINKKHSEYINNQKIKLQEYQKQYILLSNEKCNLENELEIIKNKHIQYKEIAKIHRINIFQQLYNNKKQKIQYKEYKETASKKIIIINNNINELEQYLYNYKLHRYKINSEYYSGIYEIVTLILYILNFNNNDNANDNNNNNDNANDNDNDNANNNVNDNDNANDNANDNNINIILSVLNKWFSNNDYKHIFNIIIPNLEFPLLNTNILYDNNKYKLVYIINNNSNNYLDLECIKHYLDTFMNSILAKINTDLINNIKTNINTLYNLYNNIYDYFEYIELKLNIYSNNNLEDILYNLEKTRKKNELKLLQLKKQQIKLNNIINKYVSTNIPIKDSFLMNKINELTKLNTNRKKVSLSLLNINNELLEINTNIDNLNTIIEQNKYSNLLNADMIRSNNRLFKITERINNSKNYLEQEYNNNILEINEQKILLYNKLEKLENLEKEYNSNFISRLDNIINTLKKYC